MIWSGKPTSQGRSDKDRKREEIEKSIARLEIAVRDREKLILSRAFIRDADLNKMKAEKDQLRADDNELQILKRKLKRMEEGAMK